MSIRLDMPLWLVVLSWFAHRSTWKKKKDYSNNVMIDHVSLLDNKIWYLTEAAIELKETTRLSRFTMRVIFRLIYKFQEERERYKQLHIVAVGYIQKDRND